MPVPGVHWLECLPSTDGESAEVWRFVAHELTCCDLAVRLAEALQVGLVEHTTVLQDVAPTLLPGSTVRGLAR